MPCPDEPSEDQKQAIDRSIERIRTNDTNKDSETGKSKVTQYTHGHTEEKKEERK
jgi:hypothetical protein